MKVVATALISLATVTCLHAQGLVNFANTPSTPVYTQPYSGGPFSVMSAPAGFYYFGLFLGVPNSTYTFTGIFATNTGVNGLFTGGVIAVPGWAAGTSQNYFVAGWDAGMGHDFNPIWFSGTLAVEFGSTGDATAIAGNGTSIPTPNLFDGGAGTFQTGFYLFNHLIPEPSITSMTVLGIGLLLFRQFRGNHRSKQLIRNENPLCR